MARTAPAAGRTVSTTDNSDPVFDGGNMTELGRQLRGYVERLENLISEKTALTDDMKAVRDEAKRAGLSPKVINHIIKLRATDADALAEFESTVDTYRRALGL